MLDVAADITTSGVLDCVASGTVASAEGVMPMRASTFTLSLTTNSCARRRVMSGRLVSSLTSNCTFRPATVSPFCAIYSLAAASIWRPVVACWPVIGKIRPILNGLSCANTGSAASPVAKAMDRAMPLAPGRRRFCIVASGQKIIAHKKMQGEVWPGPDDCSSRYSSFQVSPHGIASPFPPNVLRPSAERARLVGRTAALVSGRQHGLRALLAHQVQAAADDDHGPEQGRIPGHSLPQQPIEPHAPGDGRVFKRRHHRHLPVAKRLGDRQLAQKPGDRQAR